MRDSQAGSAVAADGSSRKFAQTVEEEVPIQKANLPVNGGTPSCVTLFDNFLLCFSVRNQFTSLYRYGTARECAAKWEDFKFCLSNRSLSEERKEEEWIRRRAEHWAERRVGPSSEDIWEAKKLH
ncbi:hypothetical protein P389DRAFT_160550 [Cystobasidium minutum MCA 4210]|uniref:uncharacterized protein n=1 Tax=Cystobasidium minutum MCA 4210 TaxID=1397322 RepID=UPI0034CD3AB5|eukprot:jgi/Rhomi1/160550/estExt_Genewise1Plus.C_4_t10473